MAKKERRTCLQFPIAAALSLGLSVTLQLSALSNLDLLSRLIPGTLGNILDLLNNVIALKDLAKYNVAAIQPSTSISISNLQCLIQEGHIRSNNSGDEELRPVGVLASVRHAYNRVSQSHSADY